MTPGSITREQKGRDSEAGTHVPALGPGAPLALSALGREPVGRSGAGVCFLMHQPVPLLKSFLVVRCPAAATGRKAQNGNIMYFRNTSVHTRRHIAYVLSGYPVMATSSDLKDSHSSSTNE